MCRKLFKKKIDMTRHIRVRQENQQTAIQLLQAAGFSAEPCKTPNSERYLYRSWPGSDYDWDQERDREDVAGMAGILTSASGQQAHRVFVQGGMVLPPRPHGAPRGCNCGSGQSWTICSAASQYCG